MTSWNLICWKYYHLNNVKSNLKLTFSVVQAFPAPSNFYPHASDLTWSGWFCVFIYIMLCYIRAFNWLTVSTYRRLKSMNDTVAINRWTLAINHLEENWLIDESINYLIDSLIIFSSIHRLKWMLNNRYTLIN